MATVAMGTVMAKSVPVGEERPVADRPAAQEAACCGATEQAACCGTSAAEGTAPRGGCGCR